MATAIAGIAFVLIAGTLLGNFARRLRQPPVIGEIAAGILLGPSVLGLLPGNLTDHIFPAEARPLLSAIAQAGLLLFIFMIGWEFERGLLRKRKTLAAAVSLSSVLLAFVLGVGLAFVLYAEHSTVQGKEVPATAFALFLGAAMSVTAFPVLARILSDNGLMQTRVGALALASAAVDDVVAWCLLALVSALVTAGDGSDLVQIFGLSMVYVAVMVLLVRPLLAFLVRRWTRGRGAPYLLVMLAAGVFLSSYATTWIGIHAIFGAFLFGFIMPREPGDVLESHLRKPLETVSLLLLPVFFIVTGLGVDIGGLSGRNYLELAAIIVVACAGKLIGSAAPARAFGLPWREVGTLGLLMNTRGLTELIILNAGVGLGVLDTPMFTMMVIMALVTTALAGPLLPRVRDLPETIEPVSPKVLAKTST
ncbi:cation:proton antiporter [Actinomadura sp. HBU206391]|uniref:cation:proton antiporter domain-containing protein n=1 Tax=Actinomadura sp. HBU206391 TaxID=2731692 RepID=UPI001C9D5678|nr:cation:proton antiporter [Actinomadura sp. HBU206391]